MKSYDNEFSVLYNKYEKITAGQNEQLNSRIYNLALQKSGLPDHHGSAKKRFIIAAVAAVSAAALAAATWYSASDAFRGVLKEPAQDGDTVSVQSASPIVDKTGAVLGMQQTSDDIDISLRGVVGDDNMVKILVDITSESGEPLAVRQSDGTLSQGLLDFAETELTPKKATDGLYMEYRSDIISHTGNKATMLLTFNVSSPLIGETYTLHLSGLQQSAIMDGTAFDMEPDTLYRLAMEFGDHTEKDFRNSGYSYDDATGEFEYSHELITRTEMQIPLTADLPDVQVTNGVVWNGTLHLRGIAPHNLGEDLFRTVAIKNMETGAVYPQMGSGWSCSGDADGIDEWTLSFGQFSSEENLKSCVLVNNCGENLYSVSDGEWEFEFTMDVTNLTRKLAVDKEFAWGGHSFFANHLELSPYTLLFDFTADAATKEAIDPVGEWGEFHPPTEWQRMDRQALITLKNGVTVMGNGPGSSSEEAENGDWVFHYIYDFDVVVDPDEVQSIQLGDLILQP